MTQPSEYRYIRAWHRESHPYYWLHLQKLAARDGAPLDALHRDRKTGKWVTLRDLCPGNPMITRMEHYLASVKENKS